MKLSVIITTYNSPAWLQKVLWGYQTQTFTDFEVVIADDGSTDDTRQLINDMRNEVFYTIQHVWHADEGFRKCEILNKAIVASKADYLVISDGDCIPRKDFLQVHVSKRKQGYFLSGGYNKLPMQLSETITREDIFNQNCFDINWLKANGLPSSFKNTKFTTKGFKAALLNFVTPTNASWNGHNSSAWKQDIYNVNGFNEDMRYGALDREMGERLINNGIKSLQIRYSAICVHLDHSRSYKNEKDLAANKAIWERTKKEKLKWIDHGIVKTEQVEFKSV
jgi:glycosyltransferase involved in cell wall biosynthesis